MVFGRLFGPKGPQPFELNESENTLIEDAKLILSGDFDAFAQEEAGVTMHRFGLSSVGIRLDVLVKKLKELGVSDDNKMDELGGLSLKELEEASALVTQKRDQMRAEAQGKRTRGKLADSSAIRHFKRAGKHLKDK